MGRYEDFVLEIVRAVDSSWPTLADRRFRGLGGNSDGAYAAVNLGLRHLQTFGVLESWSGYFNVRSEGPFRGASVAALKANSPLRYVLGLAPALRRRPVHAFIYIGSEDPSRFQAEQFVREFCSTAADVTFKLYRGRHDWYLWRTQTPHMLRFADRWFSAIPTTQVRTQTLPRANGVPHISGPAICGGPVEDTSRT